MPVYKQPKGKTFTYDFVFKGQRYRGSTGASDARAAKAFEKAERKRLADAFARGELRRLSGDTLDDVLGRYLKTEGHKKAGAKWNVVDHINGIVAVLGPDRPFAQISSGDVARVLEAYEATGVSPATVNRRLALFRRVYTVARDVWELDVQPINWKLHVRKEARERVRFLTVEEAKLVLKELPEHIRLMAAWTLATGCRLNESETLQWSRVNYDTRTAEVDTKGGGTRFVTLSSDAIAILSMCSRDGPYVFNVRNRRKLWEAALRKTGIKDFRWHDLRHTHATWMAQRTGLHVVQKALGHSQIATTMRYAHATMADVNRAAEELPRLLETKVEK